ncbi:hypothetical protein D3C87_1313490 [compost metagenome]
MEPESLGDGAQLRRGHQPAGGHHHEHRVHHPEDRRGQHLARRRIISSSRLQGALHVGEDLGRRRIERQAQDHDHDALPQPEGEEGALVAAGLDHVGDGHHGQRGARAEAGRRNPRRQPAPVGKPLERIAHAGAIYRASPYAADGRSEVQHRQRRRHRVQRPRNRAEQAAAHHHRARAVLVDQIALDRHQPGLGDHENGERHLDGRAAPVVFVIDRIDEQGPAVLHVGNHRHADDAEYELRPWGRKS